MFLKKSFKKDYHWKPNIRLSKSRLVYLRVSSCRSAVVVSIAKTGVNLDLVFHLLAILEKTLETFRNNFAAVAIAGHYTNTPVTHNASLIPKYFASPTILIYRSRYLVEYIKLDNVFVNYVQNEQRLSEIQLGDCGGAVSQDSEFVKESYPIGGDFMRSPETMLGLSWGTPTDVWSFGNALYGGSLK
ncbi:hypothetical protein J3E72DRAFT_266006 [Bipolaris maydis]|nr:hypothetical protein J3E72DRAFT_266006 [Bipolaris maydis]